MTFKIGVRNKFLGTDITDRSNRKSERKQMRHSQSDDIRKFVKHFTKPPVSSVKIENNRDVNALELPGKCPG
jgi:hypothetical protein